ncbi:unnamed protein product [marine sediment metagenome]|uniref:Uncharacterized protein n=1 Tax=marine sediment metagenome TaxID=412755 RepID=X0TQZ7_9ZZZZ
MKNTKPQEKKIDWDCRLDELEKQLGITGTFRNKPCCGKCGSGLKIMVLSDDKTEYVCPRCGNNIKVEHFKKYMEK